MKAQICPTEHHLLAPQALRAGWLWSAQQFWRGATRLSPVSTSERGVLFVEKRLLSKGRCTHDFVQASH